MYAHVGRTNGFNLIKTSFLQVKQVFDGRFAQLLINTLTIVPYYSTINIDMNSKQEKTLSDIFKNPILANISWSEIESLLVALGAEISEGNGSRVRIKLNGERAVFHRPHPQKETDKGAVASMRRFLSNAGVKL